MSGHLGQCGGGTGVRVQTFPPPLKAAQGGNESSQPRSTHQQSKHGHRRLAFTVLRQVTLGLTFQLTIDYKFEDFLHSGDLNLSLPLSLPPSLSLSFSPLPLVR